MMYPVYAILLTSSFVILFGIGLYFRLNSLPHQKDRASEFSELISESLDAFSKRMLSSIFQIMLYLTVVLFTASLLFDKTFSWTQVGAFFLGAFMMSLSTYLGLRLSPRLIPKILEKSKGPFKEGLSTLFKACASIGFLIIGIMLLGLGLSYAVLGIQSVIGYGVGMILAAFFLRIGGGLYKATSDIASDLASKIDLKIPYFDRRNPATILDITGDYIGKILGFGSDILSSFIFAIISCVIFSYSLITLGQITADTGFKLIALPLLITSAGLIGAVAAYFFSRWRLKQKPENFLLEGLYICAIISGLSTYLISGFLNIDLDASPLWIGGHGFSPFWAYLTGLLGAVAIGFTSEYLTASKFSRAQRIAKEASFGPAFILIKGIGSGFKSSGAFSLYLLLIILPAFYFAGFYGVAMAVLGMLSIAGSILTIQVFAPLASHTQKIVLLADLDPITAKNANRMDQLGHTTVAIGNGFAAGVAILSTLSLFFSLLLITRAKFSHLLIIDIPLMTGILLGIMLCMMFSGYLLSGLTKAIGVVVDEVIRQFKEIPYLFEDKARPDMIKASDLSSVKAMDALLIPGILMLAIPIAVGYIFGVKMLIGLVAGTLFSGLFLSFFSATTGDIINNAKHYIELGHFGGKESPNFQFVRIAAMVGDAFKDVLSPSLNILLKSVSIIGALIMILLFR